MRLAALAACLAAALGCLAGPARAEGRVALVIGNSAYDEVARLTNPANDAAAMSDALEAIGFDDVRLELDLDYERLRRALADFSRTAAGADIAVIYYAGHGIEVGGANYLIPTDAALDRAEDVEFEAMSLDTALRALAPARRLKLFILDACRDNPFVRDMEQTGATRSIGRGLARVEPSSGDTLVAYAAREGTVASDGEGENSPYAAALVRHIATPGIDVRLVFGRVRDDVLEATSGRQEPFIYGSLGGEQIFLASAGAADNADGTGAAPGAPQPPAGGQPRLSSEAAEAWAAVRDTTNTRLLEVFIERYGDTFYAELARARIEDLDEEEVAVGIFPPDGSGGAPTPGPDEFQDCDICPVMVEVPVGRFTMGSPDGEQYRDAAEGPLHEVTISRPYAAGKFEVTVEQYAAFVDDTGHGTGSSCQINTGRIWEEPQGLDFRNPGFGQAPDHPVACVNWPDAEAYAAWLTRKTGRKYRLLTESEWEYAARAGSTTSYVYGDGDFRLCDYGNTSLECDQHANTAPVGTFAANAFGLHDMHGNVAEWVADCYSPDYAGAPSDGTARTGPSCGYHMHRGGSWHGHPAQARSAARSGMANANRIYDLGFRVAADPHGA